MNLLDSCYRSRDDEIAAFGTRWIGPSRFEHGHDTLVARYDPPDDSDGQPVEIYCCALPARSYTLKALPGRNSCGEPVRPFELGTGTGTEMAVLLAYMADAISNGMLAMHQHGRLA